MLIIVLTENKATDSGVDCECPLTDVLSATAPSVGFTHSFTAKRKNVDPDRYDSVMDAVVKFGIVREDIREVLVVKNDQVINVFRR